MPTTSYPGGSVQLGAFSISLAVKDIQASRELYGKLGFTPSYNEAERSATR